MPPKRSIESTAYAGARVALAILTAVIGLTALVYVLSLGPAPVSAAPDVGYAPFDSNSTQAVTNTTTVVDRTAGPNPSVYGQSLTFRATVTRNDNGNPVPGGTVTFQDNAVNITGCVGLSVDASGQAFCTISTLAVGTHTIAANYNGFTSGGDTFNTSSGNISQTVNKADTTTTVTPTPPSPKACDTITFIATVSAVLPGGGTPSSSTVTFFDGTTTLGTGTNVGSGQWTFSTSSLSVGSHSITAVYSGNSNYNGSTSSPVTVTVKKASSTTTVTTLSPNPSTFGDPVTLRATVTGGCGTPTGIVFFNDGGVTIGTAALNASGVADLIAYDLVAGVHEISAVYQGDDTYEDSSSSIHNHTVNRRPVSGVTLVSSANPSVFGQTVTFTATVSSGIAVTPTGQVLFRDGGTVIATGNLDGSGRAIVSTADLEVGSHPITADYQGDQNFLPSTGNLTQTVNKADTTTTVSCQPNASVYGQSITCTARVTPVAPGAGTPTGTIDFKVDGTKKATANLGLPNPAEATWGTSVADQTELKPAGNHNVTATYSGDSHFTCTTCTSPNYIQTVDRADTDTKLQIPLTTIDYGQQVQMTAVVSPVPPGSGTVTGTVQFLLNSVVISSTNLTDQTPSAKYITDTLPIGTNNMQACYVHGSNPNFNDSCSDTVEVEVNKAKSKTTLASVPNPSLYGQTVTFTTVVTAAGASTAGIVPTGTVTLTFPAVGIMTGTLNALGVVIVPTNTLPVGVYNVVADYGGNAQYQPSSATWQHTVNRNDTTTTLTLSPPGSAAVGDPVTFTAIVSATGGVTPTGTVKFWDGVTVLGTGALNPSGVATFSTTSLSAGSHSLKASYDGTPAFSPSSSDRQTYTITAAGTTTTLAQSSATSVFGETVTFTATVTAAAGTPAGEVTFKDGAATLGTQTLNGSGQASLSTSALTVGPHSITAIYGGSPQFAGSTSTPLSHTVNKANTVVVITSDNPDASVVGQSVLVQYTVTAAAPGSGTPTGNVTVSDGFGGTCTATVAAGSCTLTPATTSVTQLTATYAGDSNFNGNSDTEPHQVNAAGTTTSVSSAPNPSLLGQNVTINATVTANAPGSGTPTGNVTFKDGATPIAGCTGVALSGGSATCTTSALALGPHTLNVDYGGDSNFNTSSGSTSHTVGDQPTDISVTKTDSPDPVNAGDDLTYLITVANNGPEDATVILTDTLPSQVTFKSITAPVPCTTPPVGSTGTVTCNLGTVAKNGGSTTLTIVVNVPLSTPAGTVLSNQAQVQSSRPDSNLSNNTAVQETTVFRSPRLLGDCNGDEAVDRSDIFSIVRDIFDPFFPGTAGCDANEDAKVDAGDVPCTALIVGAGAGACGAGDGLGATAGPTTFGATAGPVLSMPEEIPVAGDRLTVPISFAANGHQITSLVFSVDYDEDWLSFDPTDRDGNGIPDGVILNLPGAFEARVTFDGDDADGELDIFVADITPPLSVVSEGIIGFVTLNVDHSRATAERALRFSLEPAASFGSTLGVSVPGTATPAATRHRLFLPLVVR